MKVVFHILNILIAIAAFRLFYTGTRKEDHSRQSWRGFAWLLPVLLAVTGNIIACYYFFKADPILHSIELNASFFLAYVTLHYVRTHRQKVLQEQHTENLLMEKDNAEIEVLKLQLQPHFLFNSLNTLHHLIKPSNEEARTYVQLLAEVYRYMLKNKTKELVLLPEEISFSKQFIYLLSIRYGQAIQFNITTGELNAGEYLVMPISIQILIENAIKHNRFTIEEPLELFVNMDVHYITLQHKLRPGNINKTDSLHIGLKNLAERSIMITNKPLIVNSSGGMFTVRIPLIKFK